MFISSGINSPNKFLCIITHLVKLIGGEAKPAIIVPVAMCIAIYMFITVLSFFPDTWNVPVQITAENKEKVYQYTMNLVILLKIELIIIFFSLTYYTANAQTLPIIFLPILILILFSTIIFYVMKTGRLGKRVI